MHKVTPKIDEIITALEHVLASPFFVRSEKQSAFLRFVVERNLHGDCAPTSFEIAIDCFKRCSTDPNDAYVRNIASQSRKSLKNYYNALPQPPDVTIELAEKGYQVSYTCKPDVTEIATEVLTAPTVEIIPEVSTHKLLPTIAVIPLRCVAGDNEHAVLGHMLSDSLITSLAKSKYMRVISRRTSIQFSESEHSTSQLGEMLNADYLVEGQFYVHGDTLRVQIELCSCDNDEMIWAEQLRSSVEAVVSETDELVDQMLYGVTGQLLDHELQRALSTPLASLQCHSLLIGSINIMHRGTSSDTLRARQMLELLCKRNPLHATPVSYLAYLGLLNIIRDASNQETGSSRNFVLEHIEKALTLDSHHPIALTAFGMSKSNFDKDFSSAYQYLEQALIISPSEAAPMGRMAIAKLYTGSSQSALNMAWNAIRTSPFDPELYFFHTAAAFASFAKQNFDLAARHAEQSRELFPEHPSNLRILVGAYSAMGDAKNMNKAKNALLAAMPNFNLEDYLKGTPSPQHKVIQSLFTHLKNAELPIQHQASL